MATLSCLPFATTVSGEENDVHWAENSPYYEQDAWYDVTEWFDGNDYVPVDEDWDDYNDVYDYNTGDTEYHTTDDSQRSDYSSRSYGYDDRYANDDWFYDYYDDGYTYFYDSDPANLLYESNYTYVDVDNDGYYDALMSAHDWDGDGFYEDFDYYALNQVANSGENQENAESQRNDSSKRQQMTGTVKQTKKVSVRDTQHLVARVDSQGTMSLVDLGPASDMNDVQLSNGDEVSFAGPKVKVGDKQVIVADWVQAGKDAKKMRINRTASTIKGEVADTKKVSVRDNQHLLVILDTDNGKKVLCDCGPAKQLDSQLQRGDRVTISGVPAKANDRKLLMAESIKHNGNEMQIDRSVQNRDAQQTRNRTKGSDKQMTSRTVEGTVQSTRAATVQGNKRQQALVKLTDGGKMLVDLGNAQNNDIRLSQGDKITAHGFATKTASSKPVLIARKLQHNGQTTKIDDRQQRSTMVNAQSITGQVNSTKTIDVRGSQRQLAMIETDEGESMIVDLGKPTEATKQLEQGDDLTAEGLAVKAGDKSVLVAFKAELPNGKSIRIDRGQVQGGQSQTR